MINSRDCTYIDINGHEVITDEELNPLEDGRTNNGVPCTRYSIGAEESVWLDQDGVEVDLEDDWDDE